MTTSHQQDLKAFHTIASDFWKRIPDDAWEQKTGTREQDWTLKQALIHVLSIAQVFNKAVDHALRDEAFTVRGAEDRADLADWNQTQIERLNDAPSNGLIVQFLQELRIAHDHVDRLQAQGNLAPVKMPFYDRAADPLAYMGWQISHAGIIHGAQVTVPVDQAPLWTHFDDDLTQHSIGYYLQQWSVAYWSALGPEEPQVINFHVNGDGGGGWHIQFGPDGAYSAADVVDGAAYDLFFATPHSMFAVFTGYISIREAMVSGQLRMASDVRDTLALLKLFAPKPPQA